METLDDDEAMLAAALSPVTWLSPMHDDIDDAETGYDEEDAVAVSRRNDVPVVGTCG